MKSHAHSLLLILCFLIPAKLIAYQTDYTGIWEFTDEDGDSFLVQVASDHSVISTYSKGDNAIVPEEGIWRKSGSELHIMYNNGWMDIVRSEKSGYTKTAYAPGTAIGKKGQSSPAFKTGRKQLWGPVSETEFTGYWKLMDENQKPFYLHTKADHTAQSTYADGQSGVFGEHGTWRFEHNRIMVVYDSGWIDYIIKTPNGFKKYAFAPGQRISGKPNNTSDVEKVSMEEMQAKR